MRLANIQISKEVPYKTPSQFWPMVLFRIILSSRLAPVAILALSPMPLLPQEGQRHDHLQMIRMLTNGAPLGLSARLK